MADILIGGTEEDDQPVVGDEGGVLIGDAPTAAAAPEESSDRVGFDFFGNVAGFLGFASNPMAVPAGLATNMARDAGDMTSGLLKVGGMAVHDVKSAATEVGSLAGGSWEAGDTGSQGAFLLDNLWNSLAGTGEFTEQGSAVINDYQDRYGTETGLLGGHIDRLYENPLTFIGDALTVATMGGSVAARGAQAARALGVGKVANAVSSAGTVGGLVSTAEKASRAARVIKAIEGTSIKRWNPATQKLETVGQAFNPTRRILYQNRYEQLTSRSTQWIANKARKYADEAARGGPTAPRAAEKAEEYARLLEDANRVGATSILRPGYAKFGARRFVDKVIGFATGRSAQVTATVDGAFNDSFGTVDANVVDETGLSDIMQGVDETGATVDNIVATPGSGTRRSEQFTDEHTALGRELDETTQALTTEQARLQNLLEGREAVLARGDGVAGQKEWDDAVAEQQAVVQELGERAGALTAQRNATRPRIEQPDIDEGPTPWATKVPGETSLDDMNAVIDGKTVAPEVDLERPGMSPEAAARLGRELDSAMNSAPETVEQVGPGTWRVKNETDTLYVKLDLNTNQVISSLRVTKTGEMVADSMRGLPHTGKMSPGDELMDIHFRDAGIDTPEKAAGEFAKQTFTPSGSALAKRAASRLHARTSGPEPLMPAKGTRHRGAYDAAVEQATKDRVTFTQKLRAAFGKEAKVTSAPPKSEAATRAKALLLGKSWRDVEDLSRFRIEAEDAWELGKLQHIIETIRNQTGGKIKKVENGINNPLPDGSRGVRVVVEMPDGHPIEFQILTPKAAQVVDATTTLRGLMRQAGVLAARNAGEPASAATQALGQTLASRIKKGERLSQQLWEGVTDELRHQRGGQPPADMRRRMNDFRVAVFGALTDPSLGRGLDIESVFDRAFDAIRYKSGGRAGDSGMEGGGDPLELDQAMAEAGAMAPMYYPHMDPALMPKRGAFLRRGRVTGQGVAPDQNLRKRTGRLLAEARYSTDARQVWRIRAAQAARMQEHVDVLFDIAAEYGRILDPGEVPMPGEVLFAPGLVKTLAKQQNSIMDALADAPDGKSLGKLLDKINGDNAAEARRLIESRGDTEFVALPEHVVKQLYKHAWAPPEVLRLAVGTPTNIWKNLALAGRPAWMVNNMFSNVLFYNVLQGGSFGKVIRQLDKRYVATIREAIGPEALRHVETGGLYKDSVSASRAIDSPVGDWMQQHIAQSRPGTRAAKMADWMYRVNGGMEDAFRRASYMTAVEKAASRKNIQGVAKSFWSSKRRLEETLNAGMDEAQWRRAVDEMNSYMNDYDALGPYERSIIKPFVAPFYAFYKHAGKLLLKMPFDHPAKARLFELIHEADEERMRHDGLDPELLPGWMTLDSIYAGKTSEGDYKFLSGGGLNPFNSVLGNPLNMTHPLAKVLYEQGTGRSTFTGEQFTDPYVTAGFGQDQLFRTNPKTGEMELRETVTPSIIEHLLQQIPQYNMVKEVILGGKSYSTTSLVDALVGEKPILDPETGLPYSERTLAMALGSLFGYSERDYDVEAMQESTMDARNAAMKEYLRRRGATSSGGGDVLVGAQGFAGPVTVPNNQVPQTFGPLSPEDQARMSALLGALGNTTPENIIGEPFSGDISDLRRRRSANVEDRRG